MKAANTDEIIYRLGLTFIKDIGGRRARALMAQFGSASAIFQATQKELAAAEGMNLQRAKATKDPTIIERAEKEMRFLEKHGIAVLWMDHDNYPQRLKHCVDAPILLYYRGNADVNTMKTVAVIGTRKNSEYGQRLTEDLVEGLAGRGDIIIVSGLAHGIDAIAHKKAVKMGMPTIGVMGHGLDRIYPASNGELAREMVLNGGLLTEFPSGTKPDRQNFPMRNRIVAGISDITVVVESNIKGGAMITARIAAGYNRDVAAFPGRTTDTRSSGCNELIRTNVAGMITRADDLLEMMNWNNIKRKPIQKQLFLELQPEEQKILEVLQKKDSVHADELLHLTAIPNSQLAAFLLGMEMQGLIKALPGKQYRTNV